jgi:hypothetical protein
MSLTETAPTLRITKSLPTATLAALAHGAEEQCLLEGQVHNSENSRTLLEGTRRLTFLKGKCKI